MLKEKAYVFSRMNALTDLVLGVAAFFLAYWLRVSVLSPYLLPNLLRPTQLEAQLWLLVLLPPLTVVMLWSNNYYSSQRVRPLSETLRIVCLSVVEATVISIVVHAFVNTGYRISRGQAVVAPAVLFVLLGAKTVLMRRLLARLRARGQNFRRVVLVGSGQPLRQMIATLNNHPFWGFAVAAILTDDPAESFDSGERYGHPIVGRLGDVLGYLWEHQVDGVILAPCRASQSDLESVLSGCEEMGIRTHLALNRFRHRIAQPSVERFEDIPVLTYSPVRPMNTALLFKYAFDRVAALAALILASPLMVAVALAIRLTSRRGEPIFYGQTRCGLNGKTFTCWKFRSMLVGAEAQQAALAAQNEMQGPVFKMRNDPRVTPVGRFLRRTSLDELPQLYNVLRGEMSLVGPRPPLPGEVMQYAPWQRRRLSMRPGITCLWQVNGRNRLPFEEWMRLDLEYIDNWSLGLDLKVLLKTVVVVATGRGAM